ncbi:MAG: hypothetical protein Q8K24_04645 [Hydrogenophaga sp.]|nr:hypothetical protein [Hydrogenophaga sp.]
MEQPVLRLGLLGFSASLSERLMGWAADAQPGWPQWRSGDPHVADAWMIHGGSVEVLGRDALVIRHPAGTGERLTLNRAEVDRPLAFATPLPEGFASAEFFDADDEASVRQRLQRFEAWLRPLRTQFALGAQLVERVPAYRGGVVHLTHDNKLLAVIDMDRWQVGLHIPARPVDIEMAEWVRRPSLAADIPASFVRLPLHRVMWTYAVRTVRDVLPARYRELTVYLRRVPAMPARWFDDVHLLIMRELMVSPGTLDELVHRTGLPQDEVAHRLAALYFGGGVTTDPDSARRAEPHVRRAMVALQFDQGETDTAMLPREGDTEQAPSSSLLREAPHSPLRPARADPAAQFTVPMPLPDGH